MMVTVLFFKDTDSNEILAKMSSSSILDRNQGSDFTAMVIVTINEATGDTFDSDGVCFVALGFFFSPDGYIFMFYQAHGCYMYVEQRNPGDNPMILGAFRLCPKKLMD